jgi:LacI family transcriptional regulator
MTESVTLSDVARRAGVSPSTVSRILNGTASVAHEKRERVLHVVKQLGYRPNAMAQSLARGQSMSIGVLTQAISSPFYGETLAGIEDGLEGSGYHPIFVSGHWRTSDEREVFELLTSRRVDAVILTGSSMADEELHALGSRVPLVIVGRNVPGLEHRCISVDNISAGSLGVQHLIGIGHRRIAYISGTATVSFDATERLEAYKRTLARYDIPYDASLVVEGDYTERSGLFAVESLFARGVMFTAIACANDQSAYGARLSLYRRGIRVPDDVSLVGFDDLQNSAFTTPPMTTVRQPIVEMGRMASRTALMLLAGGESQIQDIPAELVVRESTAILRGSRVEQGRL